jgi:microcystin-dependent protein
MAYVGEIRIFAGNFNPNGWMFCRGQILSISEYETLFSLIGTTYGGDGQQTFALPNLEGRVPIHMGTGPDGTTYQIGQMAGTEQETLTLNQMPAHSHKLKGPSLLALGSNAGNSADPTGNYPAITPGINLYSKAVREGVFMADPGELNPSGMLTGKGGNQPHNNMQPYLVLNYIISLFGDYPSQS